MEQKQKRVKITKRTLARAGLLFTSLLATAVCFAGDGVTAINSAQTSLSGYLTPVSNLCLAIGAVVGIVGGVRIYIKWNSGEREIQKEVVGWVGSCIFLILVSVVITAFFT